jgi:hypothetical protein
MMVASAIWTAQWLELEPVDDGTFAGSLLLEAFAVYHSPDDLTKLIRSQLQIFVRTEPEPFAMQGGHPQGPKSTFESRGCDPEQIL